MKGVSYKALICLFDLVCTTAISLAFTWLCVETGMFGLVFREGVPPWFGYVFLFFFSYCVCDKASRLTSHGIKFFKIIISRARKRRQA